MIAISFANKNQLVSENKKKPHPENVHEYIFQVDSR